MEIEQTDKDEEMSEPLWQTEDQLATVLYEKTLFFLGALFDPRVARHQVINDLKWQVYKKAAKVLLLGNFDSENVKYQMCFATLLRES